MCFLNRNQLWSMFYVTKWLNIYLHTHVYVSMSTDVYKTHMLYFTSCTDQKEIRLDFKSSAR